MGTSSIYVKRNANFSSGSVTRTGLVARKCSGVEGYGVDQLTTQGVHHCNDFITAVPVYSSHRSTKRYLNSELSIKLINLNIQRDHTSRLLFDWTYECFFDFPIIHERWAQVLEYFCESLYTWTHLQHASVQ